ncbi:type II toxin-antitoxin system VapC family toxin [Rhodococcus sp. IEGM 1330]|uniref:type II toxin-antitoxin system VapC family toxin n=1 Tax=Rhodococcus sp. IEGM 1330 TaxID=3082225 RepID=UPI0029549D4F|nr:type II toxin-antitoxin system VapC family toxin [Rhodococcus sp. IEGM 1330]MDV8023619.1 type II toxin-antitoxin system VapC family toxin [Rhodococcus sp. IEGM 1330]
MTSFLLDTNALLWLVTDSDRMSDDARSTLADQSNELVVSAASAWEIAIKTRIGRFDGKILLSTWTETLTGMNATELPIDSTDASVAGQLDWAHNDPFDRMIVAQALRRNLTIATNDRIVLDGALTSILDTRA